MVIELDEGIIFTGLTVQPALVKNFDTIADARSVCDS